MIENYYEENDYEQSKTYCKEFLTISEELRIEKLIAKARNFLARLNSELDKFEQNKQSSEKSLSIAKGVKEKNLEAEACGGTGENIFLFAYKRLRYKVIGKVNGFK